jgi:2,2-dialkylglycine decarboxylase (pyruvate)
MGEYLAGRLEALKKYGVVREVRGKGILRGVELVKNTQTMEPFPELGKALSRTAIENRLIMRIDPTWFAVAPALIASKCEIDEMCSLIDRSLLQALEAVDGGHRVVAQAENSSSIRR